MKRLLLTLWLGIVSLEAHPNHQLDLVYLSAAESWTNDALPIGNGFLGGLVMGSVEKDRIRLSDPELRDDAGRLYSIGELEIITNHTEAKARTFTRRLDLQSAVVKMSYRHERVRYGREYFCSYPDKVLVGRMRATKNGSLNLTLSLKTSWTKSAFDPATNRWLLAGEIPNKNLSWECQLDWRVKGGTIGEADGRLLIENADEASFFLTTSVNQPGKCEQVLQRLKTDNAVAIHQRHLPDYQNLFHAMYLTLEGGAKSSMATDKRLAAYRQAPQEDPGLEELLFQYGRYLMICSSREGGRPAHRRGIWHYPTYKDLPDVFAPQSAIDRAYEGTQATQLADCAKPWLGDRMASDISMNARESGEADYTKLRKFIQTGIQDNLIAQSQDVAANMAIVGLVANLFAQSRDDGLHWMPSFPKAWSDGSVVGLRQQGYEMAFVWGGGQVIEGYLTRLGSDTDCRLHVKGDFEVMDGGAKVLVKSEGSSLSFPMKDGLQVRLLETENEQISDQ